MNGESTEQGYTLKEAAEALGVSEMTVRRHVKQGKIKAEKVVGKFGSEYRIEVLPSPLSVNTTRASKPSQDYTALINRLEQLSQEVGYWRARAELSENQIKLLAAPKTGSWWRRLLKHKG